MAAAPSVSSKSGTFSGDVAAAFVNWQLISEDKSEGIHNPPYVTKILQNTIEKMNTLVNVTGRRFAQSHGGTNQGTVAPGRIRGVRCPGSLRNPPPHHLRRFPISETAPRRSTMRTMSLMSVLAVAVAAAACRTAGTGEITDAQRTEITGQVAQVIDSLFAAMNEGNVEAITSHYRKSGDLMQVSVTETLTGWEGFATVTSQFYTQHPDVKFEHRIVQTQVLAPNVAAVTIAGSATTSEFLMWTDVLIRENGRWVITLDHESWPGARAPVTHPAMEAPPGTESPRPDTTVH